MARFDYVDRPGPHNLRVYLRSLDRIEVRWRGEASLRLWLLLRGEGVPVTSRSWSFSARLRPSLPLCKADDEAPKRRCGSYQGAREALAWGARGRRSQFHRHHRVTLLPLCRESTSIIVRQTE